MGKFVENIFEVDLVVVKGMKMFCVVLLVLIVVVYIVFIVWIEFGIFDVKYFDLVVVVVNEVKVVKLL